MIQTQGVTPFSITPCIVFCVVIYLPAVGNFRLYINILSRSCNKVVIFGGEKARAMYHEVDVMYHQEDAMYTRCNQACANLTLICAKLAQAL